MSSWAPSRGPPPPSRQGDIWWSLTPAAVAHLQQVDPLQPITDELLQEWLDCTVGWKAIELWQGALQVCPVPAWHVKALVLAALQEGARLRTPKLRVHQLDLDESLSKALAVGVAAYASLQHLTLRELNVRDEAIAPLTNSIAAAESLRTLSMEHVWMAPAGWDALGAALAENCSLQNLKLRQCLESLAPVRSLCPGLRANATLVSLDLKHNPNLGDAGLALLADALSNNHRLAELCLTGVGAGPGAAGPLAALLKGCRGLRSLDVSENNLGDKACCELARALRSAPQLTDLSLNSTGFGDGAADVLFKALTGYTPLGLTTLEVSKNRLGCNGAAALARAAARKGSTAGLRDVDLSFNEAVGQEGVEAWAGALRLNRTVRLVLAGCEVPDDALAALVPAIKDSGSLTELSLASNLLTDRGMAALVGCVGPSVCLRRLDVSLNLTGPQGLSPLLAAAEASGGRVEVTAEVRPEMRLLDRLKELHMHGMAVALEAPTHAPSMTGENPFLVKGKPQTLAKNPFLPSAPNSFTSMAAGQEGAAAAAVAASAAAAAAAAAGAKKGPGGAAMAVEESEEPSFSHFQSQAQVRGRNQSRTSRMSGVSANLALGQMDSSAAYDDVVLSPGPMNERTSAYSTTAHLNMAQATHPSAMQGGQLGGVSLHAHNAAYQAQDRAKQQQQQQQQQAQQSPRQQQQGAAPSSVPAAGQNLQHQISTGRMSARSGLSQQISNRSRMSGVSGDDDLYGDRPSALSNYSEFSPFLDTPDFVPDAMPAMAMPSHPSKSVPRSAGVTPQGPIVLGAAGPGGSAYAGSTGATPRTDNNNNSGPLTAFAGPGNAAAAAAMRGQVGSGSSGGSDRVSPNGSLGLGLGSGREGRSSASGVRPEGQQQRRPPQITAAHRNISGASNRSDLEDIPEDDAHVPPRPSFSATASQGLSLDKRGYVRQLSSSTRGGAEASAAAAAGALASPTDAGAGEGRTSASGRAMSMSMNITLGMPGIPSGPAAPGMPSPSFTKPSGSGYTRLNNSFLVLHKPPNMVAAASEPAAGDSYAIPITNPFLAFGGEEEGAQGAGAEPSGSNPSTAREGGPAMARSASVRQPMLNKQASVKVGAGGEAVAGVNGDAAPHGAGAGAEPPSPTWKILPKGKPTRARPASTPSSTSRSSSEDGTGPTAAASARAHVRPGAPAAAPAAAKAAAKAGAGKAGKAKGATPRRAVHDDDSDVSPLSSGNRTDVTDVVSSGRSEVDANMPAIDKMLGQLEAQVAAPGPAGPPPMALGARGRVGSIVGGPAPGLQHGFATRLGSVVGGPAPGALGSYGSGGGVGPSELRQASTASAGSAHEAFRVMSNTSGRSNPHVRGLRDSITEGTGSISLALPQTHTGLRTGSVTAGGRVASMFSLGGGLRSSSITMGSASGPNLLGMGLAHLGSPIGSPAGMGVGSGRAGPGAGLGGGQAPTRELLAALDRKHPSGGPVVGGVVMGGPHSGLVQRSPEKGSRGAPALAPVSNSDSGGDSGSSPGRGARSPLGQGPSRLKVVVHSEPDTPETQSEPEEEGVEEEEEEEHVHPLKLQQQQEELERQQRQAYHAGLASSKGKGKAGVFGWAHKRPAGAASPSSPPTLHTVESGVQHHADLYVGSSHDAMASDGRAFGSKTPRGVAAGTSAPAPTRAAATPRAPAPAPAPAPAAAKSKGKEKDKDKDKKAKEKEKELKDKKKEDKKKNRDQPAEWDEGVVPVATVAGRLRSFAAFGPNAFKKNKAGGDDAAREVWI